MIRFLLRRIILGIVTLVIVLAISFGLFFSGSPESVARRLAGRQATQAQVDAAYRNLGLDRPIIVQFGDFLWRLLHGDLGQSFITQVPVTTTLKQDLPVTASLVAGAAVIWLVIGVLTGVLSAVRPRSFMDRAFTSLALFFYSIPVPVLGLLLIYLLFYQLTLQGIDIFPASNYVGLTEDPFQWARHLVLPWLTLALISAATYTRLSRTSMLEVLGEDYVRTARAKGLGERRVIFRHALRSAMTPVASQFGVDVAIGLGGAILTETVFGLPGIGREAVTSIRDQNLPLILGVVIVAATAVVVANILVDMIYALLDPRVKLH